MVDELAVVAGAERFANRQHVYCFEQTALAMPVGTRENYETLSKIDVGFNVVAETRQFQTCEMDGKSLAAIRFDGNQSLDDP